MRRSRNGVNCRACAGRRAVAVKGRILGVRLAAICSATWVAVASCAALPEDPYLGVPIRTTYPHTLTRLENQGFSVGYDERRKVSAWAAYRLGANLGLHSFARPSRFRVDSRSQARVSHEAYTGSGYSRGHLAPNYAIMTRYGRRAQPQTFFMTNVVPQRQALNGGPWAALEQRIARDYANQFDAVWVLTGPLFDDDAEWLASGVEIPDAFYKVVVREATSTPRALAFIMAADARGPVALDTFLVSIDDVEAWAGLDFFHELEDPVETTLEGTRARTLWPLES